MNSLFLTRTSARTRSKASPALQCKKYLHFDQAPKKSQPAPINFAAIASSPNMEAVRKLPNLKTLEEVSLDALGTPPSVLAVAVPPSVPVFLRRNTLLSVQANLANIRFNSRICSPFSRLLLGGFTSRYQEVVGTEPFSLLVSSSSPTLVPSLFAKTTSKSFTNLTLDGSSDWAILKRDALQVYSGPSLEISVRRLPQKISRRFSKFLKLASREPTGLFSWRKAGYTFIHGRGAVGLVGNGMVYSADIGENETIAVNKAHLVGVSVNGPHDLQNCVVAYKNPVALENVRVVPPPQQAKIQTWHDAWVQSKYYYWKVFDFFRKVRGRTMQHELGNIDFVSVVGPRTILVQSGAPHETFEKKFNLPRLAPASHIETSPIKEIERIPADYLNIVTIDPEKGPVIESTDDFRDAIKTREKK